MTTIDHALLEGYLVRTRWFGGKGRPFRIPQVRVLARLSGAEQGGEHSPDVVVLLVSVEYGDDEGGVELYQVPLSRYDEIDERHSFAYVGPAEIDGRDQHLYDAVHDRDAMALWLHAFVDAENGEVTDAGGLRFHRLPDSPALDPALRSSPLSGEQSNSSLRFDDTAIMKLFRKVSPGVNPDIEIHETLTRGGSEHIAELYGWVETELDGEVLQLGMLQEFLRTAADGFELATASVRTALAEPELSVAESGGDFSGEAARLGEALAEVHATLRASFPVRRLDQQATAELARAMDARLDRALAAVPEIEPYVSGLRRTYAAVAELEGVDVQRVHGDLHLGQTLRTSHGWRIVDFEGEPGRPFEERALPDSPWRDVAGMLRSFDYAPGVVRMAADGQGRDDEDGELRTQRAYEWAVTARGRFLETYVSTLRGEDSAGDQAGVPEPTVAERTLLDAYEADKAVYEALYEKRNRPSWLPIPLGALERIRATGDDAGNAATE